MKQKKYVIWQNYDINLDDWRDFLDDCYPEIVDEYDQYHLCAEMNNEYLEDERANLNITVPEGIVVIAELGLWNGRVSGYRELKGNKISDCLYSECDYCEWYVDELGDFRCCASHHDGTNHYLYRAWKESATEAQRYGLLNKIYEGTATRADITRVTRRLGDDIANVYGWKVYRGKTA